MFENQRGSSTVFLRASMCQWIIPYTNVSSIQSLIIKASKRRKHAYCYKELLLQYSSSRKHGLVFRRDQRNETPGIPHLTNFQKGVQLFCDEFCLSPDELHSSPGDTFLDIKLWPVRSRLYRHRSSQSRILLENVLRYLQMPHSSRGLNFKRFQI